MRTWTCCAGTARAKSGSVVEDLARRVSNRTQPLLNRWEDGFKKPCAEVLPPEPPVSGGSKAGSTPERPHSCKHVSSMFLACSKLLSLLCRLTPRRTAHARLPPGRQMRTSHI